MSIPKGHSEYPYLDHLTPKERYEFLCESGDQDAEAALGLVLSETMGHPKAVLDMLRDKQWILVRPWDLAEECERCGVREPGVKPDSTGRMRCEDCIAEGTD